MGGRRTRGDLVIDASNRIGGQSPPAGYRSVGEYVKAVTGGPTAKAFNANFGKLFDRAAAAPSRPGNLWVGDEEARAVVEQLSREIGMQPLYGGPLERATMQEGFSEILMSVVEDVGAGLLFYRFAAPDDL